MATGNQPASRPPADAQLPDGVSGSWRPSPTATPPFADEQLVDEQLVEERRTRRPKRPNRRDLITCALLGGGFLVAAVAMAALIPWERPVSLVAVAVLVGGYAVLSRVEFDVGPGSAVPVQLVFVPMLVVLPVALVPLCVAGGYLLGAMPDYLGRHVHPARALVLLVSSWYAVGPALVLALFAPETPTWRDAPTYVAALAAQFALDGASSFVRERIVFGHQLRALLPAFAWLWAVDSLLAPVGLVAGLSGGAAVLVILPLAGLLLFMARDRRAHVDRAVTVGRAYRGAVDAAHRDELSGIGNRRKLLSDLERFFEAPANDTVLIVYDLNGFKHYNDTFGHPAGDALLRRLSRNLAEAVGSEGGAAYRLGGDEFCVVAAPRPQALERLLHATVDALSDEADGFAISACFGSVFIPSEAADTASALRVADQRLYAQKHARRISEGQPRAVLLEALFERDRSVHAHGQRVASLSSAVARRLGFEGYNLEELTLAAELHDVGKIGIPDAVLHKRGPLTADEWRLIEQHTLIGQRILSAEPALRGVSAIIRGIHERWDGNGYVDGLAGEAIPLAARIIAVCDAFAAMTSARPYSAPATTMQALAELRRCAGTQFDPDIVRTLCDVLREDEYEAAETATAAYLIRRELEALKS